MKRNIRKSIRRVICFVMILSLLSQNGIATVWAETDKSTTAQDTVEAAVEENSTPPEILNEIEENRGEFSKEYLLSDNSRAVIVYSEQVHYETEDGSMAEIDNSLIKTEDGYTNGSNSYDVVITDNENSQGEVVYKEDNYEISWQMLEQVSEDEETGELTIQESQLEATVTDSEPDEGMIQEDEDIHQVKQSKITFDGYQNGVSVEYEPTGDGIKENIILPTRESGNEYVFCIQLSGLKARINTNNEIEFYDEDTDEIQYYFLRPL